MKKYQIRYNTNSTNDNDRWRLIENGIEVLVSNIIINGRTYTSKDWIDDISDFKWHITCDGHCEIRNSIAYITTGTSILKHQILKTISYRILGTVTTILTAYCLGVSIEMSSLLGVGELMIKPILFFLHERLWSRKNN